MANVKGLSDWKIMQNFFLLFAAIGAGLAFGVVFVVAVAFILFSLGGMIL